MSNLLVAPYSGGRPELDEMRDLVARVQREAGSPWDWTVPRLEDWRYGASYLHACEGPGYFRRNAWLWRDEVGRLAAALVAEFEGNTLHMLLPPADDRLCALAIDWLVDDWGSGRRYVQTWSRDDDGARQALLSARGFRDQGLAEVTRYYDLPRAPVEAALPSGCVIHELSGTNCADALVSAVNEAFGHARDSRWLPVKLRASSLSAEWVLLASGPREECAAFCFVWVDPLTRSAELSPIGTRPNRRREGLARALIGESFVRLAEAGIDRVYVTTTAGTEPAEHLYDQLGPTGRVKRHRWLRRMRR